MSRFAGAIRSATTLQELADVLNEPPCRNCVEGRVQDQDSGAWSTCSVCDGEFELGAVHDVDLILTYLPVYGGEEPSSTDGVWSWDAERLLVDDMRIVPRAEWEEAES